MNVPQPHPEGWGYKIVLASLFACWAPSSASAAGFAIAEQGASAQGIAGAATARPDLAETAWYNPAAISPGFLASVGANAIMPSIRHTDPETGAVTEAERGAATPPWVHLGFVHGTGKHRFGAVVVGNVPFGAGLHWPEDWAGRFEVVSIELQVFELSASALYGIEITDDFELGAGLQYRRMRSTVELHRKIDVVNDEASVDLGGAADANGFGGSFYGRFRDFSLGANFRTAATLEFAGDAHFENVPVELSGPAHDQPVTTAVSLPERLAVGASYDLGFGAPSVEVEYFRWSRFETFGIDFQDEETPDVAEPRNWHDTATFRAGYEHRLLNRQLALRAGLAYDPIPSPSETIGPTLPDSSRVIATVGAGYTLGFGLRIDAGFGHVALLGSESTGEEVMPGQYGGSAEIISVGISYRPAPSGSRSSSNL